VADRYVLPLPIVWERTNDGVDPKGRTCPQFGCTANILGDTNHLLSGIILFEADLASWIAYATIDGSLVYQSEHRDRDEAAGACVVAMQRALDVRHP
jgi:hypothetical protein